MTSWLVTPLQLWFVNIFRLVVWTHIELSSLIPREHRHDLQKDYIRIKRYYFKNMYKIPTWSPAMLQLGLVRNAKTIQHPYSRFWIVPNLFMFHIFFLASPPLIQSKKEKTMWKLGTTWYTLLFHVHFGVTTHCHYPLSPQHSNSRSSSGISGARGTKKGSKPRWLRLQVEV